MKREARAKSKIKTLSAAATPLSANGGPSLQPRYKRGEYNNRLRQMAYERSGLLIVFTNADMQISHADFGAVNQGDTRIT